jgi:peptidyl-tRNA hydrolase, PTH1 family
MGLFDRKRNDYAESMPLYSVGLGQTLLVLGLGNIGKEYEDTRHNLGFMVLDHYRTTHDFSDWINKKDLACAISTGTAGSTRVILCKPTTFMNNSGEALQKMQHFYKINNAQTVVIYDELDIDFGTLRTRTSGSSAGHNGVKSIIAHSDDTFSRIRIGLGPKKPARMATADFVLQAFSDEQKEKLPKIIREACSLIDERTVGLLPDLTLKVD